MTPEAGTKERGLFSLSPAKVGLLAAVGALVFVVARLLLAAEGDISRFVLVGNVYGDRDVVPHDVHVLDSVGGDGQFYWRLAVDPGNREMDAAHGVTLDYGVRASRVSYPTLAYLAALGQPGLVAWSLVATNVVLFGVAAGAAARLARDRGLPPISGLLIVSATGLIIAISRDLIEVTMVAGLLTGVVALTNRRIGWATAGFSLAALAHEQALVVVAAYGLWRVVTIARRRDGPGWADAPWLVPGLGFVAAQLAIGAIHGEIPLLGSGDNNLTVPFGGMVSELPRWFRGDHPPQESLLLPQLVVVIAAVVAAFTGARRLRQQDRWLPWALAAVVTLAVLASRFVWEGPTELRQFVLVPIMAWVVIVASGRLPHGALIGATGLVWLATAGMRVLVL